MPQMLYQAINLRKQRLQPGGAYSLEVPELGIDYGEKLLITGPSGCGKSTLLDMLCLVLRPDAADALRFCPPGMLAGPASSVSGLGGGFAPGVRSGLDDSAPASSALPGPGIFDTGLDVMAAWQDGKLEALALARRHIGYVLQTGGLLPFLRVRENIALPIRVSGGSGVSGGRGVGGQSAACGAHVKTASSATPSAMDNPNAASSGPVGSGAICSGASPYGARLAENSARVCAELGITHLLEKFPQQLSVGERQRVAIARALAPNPALILADEPTAALDLGNSGRVLDLLSRLCAEQGSALVLVTHAPEEMKDAGFRRLRFEQQSPEEGRTVAVLRPVASAHSALAANPGPLPPQHSEMSEVIKSDGAKADDIKAGGTADAAPAPRPSRFSLPLPLSLAWADYAFERLLSACSVLALAAVLAPLLVLLGVSNGIVGSLTSQLLQDPRNLEVIPSGSGKYPPRWFEDFAKRPDVGFVIPQTRSIAATIYLAPASAGASGSEASLVPSGLHDPVLERRLEPGLRLPPLFDLADPARLDNLSNLGGPAIQTDTEREAPGNESQAAQTEASAAQTGTQTAAQAAAQTGGPESATPGGQVNEPAAQAEAPVIPIIISAPAAAKIQAKAGDRVTGSVQRVVERKRENALATLEVLAVLPLEAQQKEAVYVPLFFLVACEDFRDGRSVPGLGWAGNDAPRWQDRNFAGFRLYASGLDAVSGLRQYFAGQGIEVYTQAEAIESVKSLHSAFSVVFFLVSGAALFGFMASVFSNSLAAVKRKSRSLGLMRLMGLTRGGIMLFPLFQALMSAVAGSTVAFALYAVVAACINSVFQGRVPNGGVVCSLRFYHIPACYILVAAFSLLAALRAARQAAALEPSEVIRDV